MGATGILVTAFGVLICLAASVVGYAGVRLVLLGLNSA